MATAALMAHPRAADGWRGASGMVGWRLGAAAVVEDLLEGR